MLAELLSDGSHLGTVNRSSARLPSPAPAARLIRVAPEVLDSLGTRTFDGRAITAEWGEPVEWVWFAVDKAEPVYAPTFTTTDDGWLDGIRAEAAALDVERLARALADHRGDVRPDGEDYESAEAIAAAYAVSAPAAGSSPAGRGAPR